MSNNHTLHRKKFTHITISLHQDDIP